MKEKELSACDGDPDAPLPDRWRQGPLRPVFILGDHRSGTTLLYKMLAESGQFAVVTAYHVIRFGELVSNHLSGKTEQAKRELSGLFQGEGQADRVIDHVEVSAGLPEEYGFVISTRPRPRLNLQNLPKLLLLCRKIQFLASGQNCPMLLKNPWDYENFGFIKKHLPDSQFIFIHRHPVAIVNSQLSAIRSLLIRRNDYVARLAPWYAELSERPLRRWSARMLFSSRLGIWPLLVVRHVVRAAGHFVENFDSLPPQDRLSIRYEDLCMHPQAVVGQILSFLGLEAASPVRFEEMVAARNLKLLPEVAARKKQIERKLQSYLRLQGYNR